MRDAFPRWLLIAMFAVLAAGGLAAPRAQAAVAVADSVRSNLWLVQAMMSEIVTAAAQSLPQAPAQVFLEPSDDEPACAMFATAAFDVLTGKGYELYSALDEDMPEDFTGVVLAFEVLDIDLAYPRVGRSLGIWKQWVGRQMKVTVKVKITEAQTGRLLLLDDFEREFHDRVPAGDFQAVNSRLYEFTTAEIGESGWNRRLEEIVVVSTLAGLVAVYFANTSN